MIACGVKRMYKIFEGLGSNTEILISIALMLLAGFLVTRLTKLARLPNATGFILAGVLLGEHVLNAIPHTVIAGMGFFSDMALAFISFGVGRFFKRQTLSRTGGAVIVIALLEALLAAALVMLAMLYLFKLELYFSLLLGAVAAATAPASTMMTVRQYGASGRFVDQLLQMIALDNMICLLVFGVASTIIGVGGALSLGGVLLPIAYNLGSLALGALCAVILSKLLGPRRSQDNRLILAAAMLIAIAGVCSALNTSPLLACMGFGAVYVNLKDDDELFMQMDGFTPPILSAFFVLSGMRLEITALGSFGLIGLAYFLIRFAGKYAGSLIGCRLLCECPQTRRWLGLGLMPQAAVAVSLAFLAERMLPAREGAMFLNIILASSVLYELIGPACAKLALARSGAIEKKES